MKITVPLVNNILNSKYGKHAPSEHLIDGTPVTSFPITISGVPEEAQSLALTLIDWDAISVGGFPWIHWIAAGIDPKTTLIPENASQAGFQNMIQGANSTAGKIINNTNPLTAYRYNGPQPPDKPHEYTLTVLALDNQPDLKEGFWLNDLRHAMANHIIDVANLDITANN